MTLTKWNADLIDGLDELDVGEIEGDYLPLEGGTLTGELTVDANLILEGAITEGQSALKRHSQHQIEIDTAVTSVGDTPAICRFSEKQYILSPSQGTMQHLTMEECSTRFILIPDKIPEGNPQSDQDYFFEDGQSMSLRLEVHDLDKPLAERKTFRHTWCEDIWWVNTKDGLAPDVNETGVITVNLWKAKGVLYGQLAGDFVKQPEREEYHPNAFDISKLKWELESQQPRKPQQMGPDAKGPPECRIYGPDPKLKDSDIDWPLFVHEPQPGNQGDPEYGITQRGGVTFTRTSRDGRHYFVGQTGSSRLTGSADNPGEYRTFTNSLPSDRVDLIKWEYDSAYGPGYGPKEGAVPTPAEIPFRFHCGARDRLSYDERESLDEMYTEAPKLLGTAVDMKLRVEKGSGIDFNPDGTRMFQSVEKYLDPSLRYKYENVIGVHHLSTPWDVGTTDFLVKEELNDIIYCDKKYSELRALHTGMRVCGLTFRPDGMGFYFAYVVYEESSSGIDEICGERHHRNLLHFHFVQQDLTVPWELSSAKEEYKYSKLFSHKKYEHARIEYEDNGDENWWLPEKILKEKHINCITVSNNGKYLHVALPALQAFCEKPRQFEMTTPWDISTTEFSWVGIGPIESEQTDSELNELTWPSDSSGGFAGHRRAALTHGIHWNASGTKCYVTFVAESDVPDNPEQYQPDPNYDIGWSGDTEITNTCHYFNQKAWEIDYDKD